MMRRLASGIGANVYGQGVTVVAQVFALPVLLHAWGPSAVGTWLTLLASTSLLALADGGLMVAAGTAANLAVGRGDVDQAGIVLRHLLRVVIRIAIGGGAAIGGLVAALGVRSGALDPRFEAAAVLGLAALVGLPLGTAELGFRATGRYARGMAISSSVRLGESVAVVVVGVAGGSFRAAAVVLLIVRIAGSVVAWTLLRWQAPELWRAIPAGRPNPLRPLFRPALAALALPAALAVSLQGTTVAASLVVPAEAVASLVVARTLARTIVQAIGLVTHALMPEYGFASGRGDRFRLHELLRANLLASVVLLVPGWAGLVLFGPAVLQRWTGPTLQPDPLGFDLLASAALAHGVWLSAANLRLAVNRQGEFAHHALAVAAATAVAAVPLGRLVGVPGVAVASLLGELAMVTLIVPPQVRAALQPVASLQSAPVQ